MRPERAAAVTIGRARAGGGVRGGGGGVRRRTRAPCGRERIQMRRSGGWASCGGDRARPHTGRARTWLHLQHPALAPAQRANGGPPPSRVTAPRVASRLTLDAAPCCAMYRHAPDSAALLSWRLVADGLSAMPGVRSRAFPWRCANLDSCCCRAVRPQQLDEEGAAHNGSQRNA